MNFNVKSSMDTLRSLYSEKKIESAVYKDSPFFALLGHFCEDPSHGHTEVCIRRKDCNHIDCITAEVMEC
jgi:hypothetical protein